MTNDQPWRNETRLRRMYLNDGLSTYEIAEVLGCSRVTVSNWLSTFDIDRRGPQPDECVLEDESLAREPYLKQELSLSGVAEEAETTVWKVRYWLKKHGIETRDGGGSRFATTKLTNQDWLRKRYLEDGATTLEIADELDCTARTVNTWMHKYDIECPWKLSETEQEKLSNPDWLRWAYDVRDMSVAEIAANLNCSEGYVYKHLGKYGITGFDMVGEDPPRWNGGEYAYGRGCSSGKRETVRTRDDNECQLCGMDGEEHHAEYGTKLHVHHILKARNVADPEQRNATENLMTLCASCHVRAENMAPKLPEGIDE